MLHPAWRTLFKRAAPLVKLLDVKSSIDNITVYTFSACNIPDLGACRTRSDDDYKAHPHIRSPSRRMIVVIVHTEDAAITWTISSCSIGGVNGVVRIDRGGGTSPINTAIFTWDTESLNDIADTDIVVTASEAVTACAIGVLSVENIGVLDFAGSGEGTSTGEIGVFVGVDPTGYDINSLCIGGSTVSSLDTFSVESKAGGGETLCGSPPEILYDQNPGSEFSFAAFWSYSSQYLTEGPFTFRANWSGAGTGDVVIASFV